MGKTNLETVLGTLDYLSTKSTLPPGHAETAILSWAADLKISDLKKQEILGHIVLPTFGYQYQAATNEIMNQLNNPTVNRIR